MLTQEMKNRVSVVAAVNGGRISVQNMEIIALTYDMEDALDGLKDYCRENSILVFDEVAEAEAAAMAAVATEKEGVEEETVKSSEESDYLKDRLEELFQCSTRGLTHREAEVPAYRFGLIDGTRHTLEETGRKFGISRERVRQIESKLFRKYCGCFSCRRRRPLPDYLD